MMMLLAAEGDVQGLPHLTAELASHIVTQYHTEGVPALTKSLDYGDGAARELAELFIGALRSYESTKMRPQLRLNAKSRLLASSTYDFHAEPVQNMNVHADVDTDSRKVIETELGDARKGHAAAKARGHEDAVSAYENLISELERANTPPPLKANDTSDFGSLPTANPSNSSSATDHEAEEVDNEILGEESCLIQADTEDPISDGDAFDMLIDGDPEDDEPVVQELTNNDGGVEPPTDQPLLRDDVSGGPPTL